MTERLLLDLFCGAGGCSVGYRRAGFEVVGVDIKPQPRYPFPFREGDALETLEKLLAGHSLVTHGGFRRFELADIAAIHASPPCQAYSQVNRLQHLQGRQYPLLIDCTRELLIETGKAYVIENVEASTLRNAIRLCGSSFGLLVRRHRLFECNRLLFGVPECRHWEQDRKGKRFPTCFRSKKGPVNKLTSVVQVYGHTAGKKLWKEAMGIDWMTSKELTQAIPPAYTEWVGRRLMALLEVAA